MADSPDLRHGLALIGDELGPVEGFRERERGAARHLADGARRMAALFDAHREDPPPPGGVTATTEENPMSVIAELENTLGRLKTIGEETVAKVEEMSATPAGKALLDAAHSVIVSAVPGAGVDLAIVETVLRAFIPAPAAPAAPAVTNQG